MSADSVALFVGDVNTRTELSGIPVAPRRDGFERGIGVACRAARPRHSALGLAVSRAGVLGIRVEGGDLCSGQCSNRRLAGRFSAASLALSPGQPMMNGRAVSVY